MPLESLQPDEPPKIQHLLIEEPEKKEGLFFDPERDIPPEKWEEVRKQLKEKRDQAQTNPFHWVGFVESAKFLALLFPFDALLPDAEDLRVMQGYFSRLQNQPGQQLRALIGLSGLHVLFREQALPQRHPLFREILKEMFEKRALLHHSPYALVDATQLFPEQFSAFTLTEDDHTAMMDTFREYKITRKENDVYMGRNAIDAMYIKLLFPSMRRDALLSEAELQQAKSELQNMRPNELGFDDFPQCAFALKVITAEKAYISDSGVIVINNREPEKNYRKNIPPVPQVKEY